jgi:kynurenine formamidase
MMNQQQEIPVYLFTGFLGGGKTTFIQDILSTTDFNEGERTLLLLCEEGEEDYDPSKFSYPNVYIETIEDEEDLTQERLKKLEKRHAIDRVVIEYNGMWMLQTLFQNMPQNWLIYQEVCFHDATTFLMYNQNMRQLSFDKMQTAELNIFNRCEKGFDKMPFHKEVRIANRRAQICYEYGPEDVEQDDIEDPLPYDMEAPVVEIKDEWYAEWYRDINENPQNYEGKTMQLRVRIAMIDELPKGKYAMGRHVMTCCVEDIQFAGLVYVYDKPLDVKKGDWVMIKGKVKNEYEQAYQEEGPVIYCEKAWKTKAPDPEVATF